MPAPADKRIIATRIVVMVLGLFLLGFGIGLSQVSTTGVSPISAAASVGTAIARDLSIDTITMGMLSFFMNSMCFMVELALLRRNFNPWQVLQVAALCVMTLSIDFGIFLFGSADVSGLGAKIGFLAASLLLMSLGIHLEVAANVVMVPGDAMVATISYTARKQYSRVKIATDLFFVSLGLLLSLLYFKGIVGIGVGTVVSAVCVGALIKVWARLLAPLERRLGLDGESLLAPVVPHVY
jgi:uncharacterized membrane protein YczE